MVPVCMMPTWLRSFANNQPLSVTVTAVRALLEGGSAAHDVWLSLAWSVGLIVMFFALAIHLYRHSIQCSS